jgi:hypothetical protein
VANVTNEFTTVAICGLKSDGLIGGRTAVQLFSHGGGVALVTYNGMQSTLHAQPA